MHRTEFRFAFSWLLAAATLTACGPEGASPMPEPPSLQPSKLGPPEGALAMFGGVVTFSGGPGATINAVFVRVTNLDATDPVAVTTVAADGSFTISLPANDGDELRLQATNDTSRGEPLDVTYRANPFTLIAVNRPLCVELTPGYELDFTGAVNSTLGVTNQCAAAIALGATTTRLGLPEFSVTSTPASIPTGSAQSVSVGFTPPASGEREEVLFLPIDVSGQTVRYPVTLFGTPAP